MDDATFSKSAVPPFSLRLRRKTYTIVCVGRPDTAAPVHPRQQHRQVCGHRGSVGATCLACNVSESCPSGQTAKMIAIKDYQYPGLSGTTVPGAAGDVCAQVCLKNQVHNFDHSYIFSTASISHVSHFSCLMASGSTAKLLNMLEANALSQLLRRPMWKRLSNPLQEQHSIKSYASLVRLRLPCKRPIRDAFHACRRIRRQLP